jgi:hypothetical protein
LLTAVQFSASGTKKISERLSAEANPNKELASVSVDNIHICVELMPAVCAHVCVRKANSALVTWYRPTAPTPPAGNCPSKFEQDGRENSAHNLRLQPAGESVFVENKKKGNGMPGHTVNGLSIHPSLSLDT